ncbi:MAG: cell-wall, partial [Pseudomonadota bacterium]
MTNGGENIGKVVQKILKIIKLNIGKEFMSYKNLQEAIKLIEQNIEKCDSIRPQLDDNIVNAEINLGVIFPKSYKKFLKLIGRLSLGSVDVFGLTFNDYSQYIPNDVVCE